MKIYILGICGTATGSLAILLKQKGHDVFGSDKNFYPPIYDLLKENNLILLNGFIEENIKKINPDIVIIGNAIVRRNPELEYILNNKIRFYSLPEALRHFFLWETKNIVITGTHGKTTTTSLISYIFEYAQKKFSFLIGGIPLDFKTSARFTPKSKYFIIEGDEYDTAFFDKRSKFIHYLPDTLIINNIEFDHADIFNTLEDIQKSFYHLVRTLPTKGLIIYNGDDKNIPPVLKELYCKKLSFGESEKNDLIISYQGLKNNMENAIFKFKGNEYYIKMKINGKHNILNAAASFLTAYHYRIPSNIIVEAIQNFSGVVRRLNILFNQNNKILIEDFAHHPTAIKYTIETVKNKYPDYELIYCQHLSNNTSYRNIHLEQYKICFQKAEKINFILNPRYYKLPDNEKLNLKELENHFSKERFRYFDNFVNLFNNLKPDLLNEKKQIILISSSGSLNEIKELLLKFFKEGE